MKKSDASEKRKRLQQGFTLTEMLITVLLMLMSAAALASGVAVAQKAQAEVTDAANAQLLLSTSITVLRHELGTADQVVLSEDASGNKTTIVYRTSTNGSTSTILLESDGIKLIQYSNLTGADERKAPIVSGEAATPNLTACYDRVTKSGNVLEFVNLVVKKGDNVLASQASFKIQTAEN